MRTGIDRLLAVATGPTRLRQELELKSKPIARLSHMLAKTETLQTAIPNELLGGELLVLLSDQLQNALLLVAEGPPEAASQPGHYAAALQPEFAPAPTRNRLVPPPLAAASKTGLPHAAGAPVDGRDRQEPVPEPGAATHVRNHLRTIESRSGAHPQPEPGEAQAGPDRARPHVAPQSQQQALGRPRPEPPLARQLRRYWQLSGRETVSSSMRNTPSADERQRPGVSWPLESSKPSSTRTWPDLIGQTVARKASHLQHHAHSSWEQSQQSIHADTPENVEIRNVFNIALPGHGDRDHQTDTQLAESIADILREQALQHGVDLT